MDKEAVPWSTARLLATVLAIGICAGLTELARRGRSAWRWPPIILATAVAFAWASAGAFDDFLSPDAGPAMRLEFGCIARWYGMGLLVESVAPILVFVALG